MGMCRYRNFPVKTGGERGIRTLDTLLEYARFPGVCLKPLSHLSIPFIYNALLTRSGAKLDNLILQCYTVLVKESKTEANNHWQKTPVSNLVRYVASGILFARIRVQGKLIRRS